MKPSPASSISRSGARTGESLATGFQLPPGIPRWAPPFQIARRGVLSKGRNHLLSRALDDEDWVLWIDVDVIASPPDVIETFLETGRDLVHPHCLHADRDQTFDLNAWRDQGRLHLGDLESEGEPFRLLAVAKEVRRKCR